MRWRHPERGLVLPDEFISGAERIGLIRELTDWVLETGLRQCGEWKAAGAVVPIAVNASVRILRDSGLAERVRRTLERLRLDPKLLTFEITESVTAEPLHALATLAELREAGVRLSIDDFGVGSLSLRTLKQLPVDEIKIDRSFVTGMETQTANAAVVRSVDRPRASPGLPGRRRGRREPEARMGTASVARLRPRPGPLREPAAAKPTRSSRGWPSLTRSLAADSLHRVQAILARPGACSPSTRNEERENAKHPIDGMDLPEVPHAERPARTGEHAGGQAHRRPVRVVRGGVLRHRHRASAAQRPAGGLRSDLGVTTKWRPDGRRSAASAGTVVAHFLAGTASIKSAGAFPKSSDPRSLPLSCPRRTTTRSWDGMINVFWPKALDM